MAYGRGAGSLGDGGARLIHEVRLAKPRTFSQCALEPPSDGDPNDASAYWKQREQSAG